MQYARTTATEIQALVPLLEGASATDRVVLSGIVARNDETLLGQARHVLLGAGARAALDVVDHPRGDAFACSSPMIWSDPR